MKNVLRRNGKGKFVSKLNLDNETKKLIREYQKASRKIIGKQK
jgi:hypothetical protein